MEQNIILSHNEIQEICKRIGSELDERFAKSNVSLPVFIGVLKGSLNFMMDLIKNVKTPIMTDYIQVSSYQGTSSTGAVILKKDISLNIKDKTVVIIEDIIDTGLTMKYLVGYLKEKYCPKEIIVCSLFGKEHMRKVDLTIDYVGKNLTDDAFLIGYGLDYNEVFRNLPDVIGATKEDIIAADKLLKENQ